MMEDGLAKKFPGRTEIVVLPSIPRIVNEYQKTKGTDQASICKVVRGLTTFWVMRTGTQAAVDVDFANSLVNELRQHHEDWLRE